MINRLLNRFGARFYTSPKEYSATYEVAVKNTSSSRQTASLIVPVVPVMEYQKLIEETKFIPAGHIATEAEHKNKYLVHDLALDPGEEAVFKQIFKIKVTPRTGSARSFKLADYAKLDEKQKKLYLQPNRFIKSGEPEIIELAQNIVGNETSVQVILEAINAYVTTHLEYGNPIMGLYRATDALHSKVTDCGGFDTVFISLCRSLGIPARVVSGFWAGYHQNDMHAWVEILLPDGSWMPADPSMEHLANDDRTRKSGKLGFVGSDRVALSVGCDLELSVGHHHILADILQNPIVHPENEHLKITRIFATQPV